MQVMKKYLMAAVALVCMMTSIVLNSCTKEEDRDAPNKEYVLKISYELISQGDLTSEDLNYLENNFKDKETKNMFTNFFDAKTGTDNSIDVALSGIKTYHLYAEGCEYKVYFKLYDAGSEVYKRTIYVKDESYRVEN